MDSLPPRLRACVVVPRLPGGSAAARKALLALLPALIGGGLLLLDGDRPSTHTSLIETTQAPVVPLDLHDPGTTSDTQSPATPGGQPGTETTVAGLLGPASSTETTSTPGPGPGPGWAVGTTPGGGTAATTTEPGTGRAGALDGGLGDSDSAATAAPRASSSPADEGATSTVPPATPRATTPTTRAPDVTTTTTTTAAAPVPTGRSRNSVAEAEIVPLTNRDRSSAGLGTLSRNACLDSIASGYAEQMARRGVLAHNPGAGPAVLDCRPGGSWGDNVGTASPCDTTLLETEWMASPTHRRNILTGAFQLIGVGAWTDENGDCWVQVLFSS
ncbi:MAG: CAP domain-containing protein [Acidimicrobiales bacterium]